MGTACAGCHSDLLHGGMHVCARNRVCNVNSQSRRKELVMYADAFRNGTTLLFSGRPIETYLSFAGMHVSCAQRQEEGIKVSSTEQFDCC